MMAAAYVAKLLPCLTRRHWQTQATLQWTDVIPAVIFFHGCWKWGGWAVSAAQYRYAIVLRPQWTTLVSLFRGLNERRCLRCLFSTAQAIKTQVIRDRTQISRFLREHLNNVLVGSKQRSPVVHIRCRFITERVFNALIPFALQQSDGWISDVASAARRKTLRYFSN